MRVLAKSTVHMIFHTRVAVFFYVLAAVFSGCASTQTISTAELLPISSKLPSIRLFIDDGTGGDPRAFNYRREIIEVIEGSGLFDGINSGATENRIELYLSNKNNTSINPAHFLLAAATLFLMPIEHDETFKLQVRVHGKAGSKEYTYEDRRKWKSSLARPDSLNKGQLDSADRFRAVRNLVIHFLNDIRNDSPIRPLVVSGQ